MNDDYQNIACECVCWWGKKKRYDWVQRNKWMNRESRVIQLYWCGIGHNTSQSHFQCLTTQSQRAGVRLFLRNWFCACKSVLVYGWFEFPLISVKSHTEYLCCCDNLADSCAYFTGWRSLHCSACTWQPWSLWKHGLGSGRRKRRWRHTGPQSLSTPLLLC